MPPNWTWSGVDVAVPRRPLRIPGLRMAGFRQRAPAFWDIAMVAHPSVALLFDLSDGGGIAYDLPDRREHGSVVAGLLPGPVRATGLTRGDCLQIRMEPAIAVTLLGASADLTGAVVPLDDVWGRGAARAEDMLRAAGSWDERFTIAERLLARRLGEHRPVEPEVAHAWRQTLTSRGLTRVEGLAGEIGWSRKRLWARFRAQLGVTPKRAAQLIRFDHAAHLLAAGHPAAGVAAAGGYADQSHLHREARAFTGLTPSGVAAAPWLAIDRVAWPS